ncbi:MAG: hypothetical protein JWN34_4061 [Bryobacterales bacterium]|jgi:uncharacterized protein (TIGR03435 family)|nr:hypothetical protein [Bryobacterales bacterium]
MFPSAACGRAFIALLCGGVSLAQAPSEFEVTSIKLWRENYSRGLAAHGGVLQATTTLRGLMTWAFDTQGENITGLPAWGVSEEYEVRAKAARPEKLAALKLLGQAMLADRFGLRLHRETKIVPGYVLLRDPKRSLNLPEAEEGTPQDGIGSVQIGQHEITTRGLSMPGFTRYLAYSVLHAPVEDRTFLAGIYSFKLQFDDPAEGNLAVDSGFGSVFSAVESVGLQLKRGRVVVVSLRVDEVRRPELDGNAP